MSHPRPTSSPFRQPKAYAAGTDHADDGPIERMLRIAVVSRGARRLARFGTTPTIRDWVIYRAVIYRVVTRVQEHRCSGEAGRRARDIKRCQTNKHRRYTGQFQDLASGNGFQPAEPNRRRQIAHRAMVTIPLLS